MKRLLLFFIALSIVVMAQSQIPTYRWVSGSQSTNDEAILDLTEPGPRLGSSSFLDSQGTFWLFGGRGQDLNQVDGYYNDVWNYDPSTQVWSWIDGQMIVDRDVPEYNNSLKFDGIDDYVVIPQDPVDYTVAFTFELWLKTTSDGPLVSWSPTLSTEVFEGWRIELSGGGSDLLLINRFGVQMQASGLNLADDNWHHIAFVYKDAPSIFTQEELTFFIDGTEAVTLNRSFSNNLNPNALEYQTMLAAYQGDNMMQFFQGQLDEARFWNHVRNAGEIQSSYIHELGGSEEGLAGYYNFNQGIADSDGNNDNFLTDLTEEGNDGVRNSFIFRPGVFIGQMANVRVWDQMLSASEINASASGSVVGSETGLVLAYDFSDGVADSDNTSITQLTDLTANSYDGDLYDFTLNGSSSNFSTDNLRVIATGYGTATGTEAVVTADLTSDGYEDIITAHDNGQEISVIVNDQTGAFGTATTFSVGSYSRDLTVGLWNNDLIPDIAVTAYDVAPGDDRIRVFFGNGSGGFSSTSDITFVDGTDPTLIKTADIDGDTNDDIVVILSGLEEIAVYFGDGMGAFPTSATYSIGGQHYEEGFVIDDFTNDGDPDIVLSVLNAFSQPNFGVLINNGDGTLADIQLTVECCFEDFRSTDFNNDGNRDLLFRNGSRIGSYTGFGDGTFEAHGVLETEFFFLDFDVADVNGDNVDDILVTSTDDHAISIYDGNSDGGFTFGAKANIENTSRDILVADLDMNGEKDFVISNWSDAYVILREDVYFDRSDFVQILDFDGNDDRVEMPDLRPFDGDFTWEGWVNTEDNGPIFSFSDPSAFAGFTLAIKNKVLTFNVDGVEMFADNTINLTDDNWHHIALAVNVTTGVGNEVVNLYVDGVFVMFNADHDFDLAIGNNDLSRISQLGNTSDDFLGISLQSTGLAQASNFTTGVELPENETGRAYNASWIGDDDNLYVFGGQGLHGLHNSIRQFNTTTETWTTIKGVNFPWDPGNYGTLNVADPGNIPPARWLSKATKDNSGNIWTFGGAASDNPATWFNDLWMYDPMANEWTWKSGTSLIDQLPEYGTLGVSDPANVPGARENSQIWHDSDGNIWIFGGFGYDGAGETGHLNDLWMFNVTTLEWTWIGGSHLANQGGTYGTLGVYDAANMPGSRVSGIQWVDSDGVVWFFGGQGYDKFGIAFSYLNDLWSYDPTSNQWAWHSGSDFGNSTGSYNETGLSSVDYVPGARWHSTGWVDANDDLWLFGGFIPNQVTTGFYNDFWKFEPGTREWTWFNGFNSTAESDEQGEYGDITTGSRPHPSGRHGAVTWEDGEGNFWLYGGTQIGSSSFGMFNDLWKYEAEKDLWTYLGGNTVMELNEGEYGSKGIGSSNNEPKSRWHSASWIGDDGKLWFFGGLNQNTNTNTVAWLNDLWFYDPESDVYTWMGGDSDIDGSPTYGAKGEASAAHIPGARSSSAYWKDDEGNFWLFGGYESFEYNNDLWKFNPNTLEWTWVSGNNFQNTPGTYGTLGVADPENQIGARRYTNAWKGHDGNIWIFGGQGIDSQAQLGQLNDLWKYEPQTNLWTWMGGNTEILQPGNYGTKGVASPDNLPPPRNGHITWTDDSGNLWLFGGASTIGEIGSQTTVNLNDLWKYDIRTNMWTWVDGSSDGIIATNFGTQGVFDESNVIPGLTRGNAFAKFDKSLRLVSGRINTSTSYGDLWEIKFTPGEPIVDFPHSILQEEFTFTYDEPWTETYQVQVALSNDFSDVFYDELLTSVELNIGSLEPGTRYYYRVNAINEIGSSGFGAETEVLTLPSTPVFATAGLDVTDLTSTSATINWTALSGIFDGFLMDVSKDNTFLDGDQTHSDYTAKTLDQASLAEPLTGLDPGTHYSVRLKSFNSSGESEFSETISFLTKPASPEDGQVNATTQNGAGVSWTAVPEILDGYQVTVSTDPDFLDAASILDDYNFLDIDKETNQVAISGLDPGTRYYVQLYAQNTSGLSDPSATISILTLPESPIFDIDAAITSVSQSSAEITWQAPPEIYDGYRLEVSLEQGFSNTNLMLVGYGRDGMPKDIDKSESSDLIENLLPGQRFYARIRAYNASGQSPNSNVIEIETVPRAPAFNAPGNVTQTSASLSWSSPSGVETFLLDLNTSDDFDPTTALFSEFPLAVPFEALADLEPGTRYYARIQSSNGSGASGSASDYDLAEFITIPADPALNDVDTYTQSDFRVSWPAVEGASTYEVDASNNFFQTFLNGFNSTEITDTEITITNLSPGDEYQVRVRSKNESGVSSNTSVFDLETLPATPIARDASNISASVFSTNWDPSDGADYYVLEVSLDNFVTFHYNETLTSSNPVQMTNLVAGAQYQYRIKAGNSSGESPYSNIIAVVAQNSSSALNITTVEFNQQFAESTTSTEVTVNVAGGLGNPTVTLRHRPILSNTWSELKEMAAEGGTAYSFEVLEFMLDDIGLEFEVYANDGVTFVENLANKIKRTFSESESAALPSLVFNGWQMISIPYILEDDLVTSIFNELGSQEYKKQWRIMHYQNQAYLDGITGFTRIELGKGYWFNTLNEVTINVGAGETNADIPFELSLNQGWNQIGNPYNTSVNWSSLLINQGLTTTVEDLVIYDSDRSVFTSSPILEAFQAAFVWAEEETVVQVSPSSLAGRVSEEIVNNAFVEGSNWFLPIMLNIDGTTSQIAGVGMNEEASLSKDHLDRLVPPRFIEYLEMFTTNLSYSYPYFSTDIVPTLDEFVWEFELVSNHKSGLAAFEWDSDAFSGYYGIWLVDEVSGQVIKMSDENQHSFSFNGSRDFSVHFSKDPNYKVLPSNLVLGDPYPNPTNALSKVPVLLPERHDPYELELAVFDIQGRKIKTISNGSFNPGLYEFEWNVNGEAGVPAGIYLYKLSFRDPSLKSIQKKLIIRK